MTVKVKINGKVKEFKTLQAAINAILHNKDNVEFLIEHGNGD